MSSAKTLDADLQRLAGLSLAELRDEWLAAYGDAPPSIAPALLRLGIAYRWQEKLVGKLPARLARRLDRDGGAKSAATAIQIAPGTQLVRSWNGRTLSVAVMDDGRFAFEDRTYRSLSAIARAVTGTAWSGPRFFGLEGAASHG